MAATASLSALAVVRWPSDQPAPERSTSVRTGMEPVTAVHGLDGGIHDQLGHELLAGLEVGFLALPEDEGVKRSARTEVRVVGQTGDSN